MGMSSKIHLNRISRDRGLYSALLVEFDIRRKITMALIKTDNEDYEKILCNGSR
jgi:hypothetical protein